MTRSHQAYLDIFSRAGLEIVYQEVQLGFPKVGVSSGLASSL